MDSTAYAFIEECPPAVLPGRSLARRAARLPSPPRKPASRQEPGLDQWKPRDPGPSPLAWRMRSVASGGAPCPFDEKVHGRMAWLAVSNATKRARQCWTPGASGHSPRSIWALAPTRGHPYHAISRELLKSSTSYRIYSFFHEEAPTSRAGKSLFCEPNLPPRGGFTSAPAHLRRSDDAAATTTRARRAPSASPPSPPEGQRPHRPHIS